MFFSKNFRVLSIFALIVAAPHAVLAATPNGDTTITSKRYVDNKIPADSTAHLLVTPDEAGGNAAKRPITTAGTGITELENANSSGATNIPTALAVKEAITNATNDADISDHTVNGAPLSNEASYYYGTSSTAGSTSPKTVQIDSISTLAPGQIIVVTPSVTSNKITAGISLKLNNFDAYPMKYNNTAVGSSYYSTVWVKDIPTAWLFDGANWVFLAKGVDSNTTYSGMSQDEITVGTVATNRLISPKLLRDNFYTETETDTLLDEKQDKDTAVTHTANTAYKGCVCKCRWYCIRNDLLSKQRCSSERGVY